MTLRKRKLLIFLQNFHLNCMQFSMLLQHVVLLKLDFVLDSVCLFVKCKGKELCLGDFIEKH